MGRTMCRATPVSTRQDSLHRPAASPVAILRTFPSLSHHSPSLGVSRTGENFRLIAEQRFVDAKEDRPRFVQ